jgi:hypothetical protein
MPHNILAQRLSPLPLSILDMMIREVSIRSEIAMQLLLNALLYVNTKKENEDLKIRIVVDDIGIDYDDLPLLLTILSYAGVRGRVASLVYRTETYDIIEFIQYWVKGTGAVEAYIYELEARDEDQAKRKIKEEITEDPLDIKVDDDRYRFEVYIFDKEKATELFMPRARFWLHHICKKLLEPYNEQIRSVVFHGIEAMLAVAFNNPEFKLIDEAYKHLGDQAYTMSYLQRVLAVSPYIIQRFPQDEDVKHIYNDLMRVIELSRRLKDPDPIFSRELSKEEAERIHLKHTGLPSQIFIRPLIEEIRYRTEDGTVVHVFNAFNDKTLDSNIMSITLPLYREAYRYCQTMKENDDIIKEIKEIVRPYILATELTS